MFLQNGLSETVVLLDRENVDREYVYIDCEPKDNEYMKFTKKSATYKQISDWVLSEYGFKISNLYIAQGINDEGVFGRYK